ncbi:DgyrCDS5312 [Dimorphilus gyrociliatus]|uniref:Transcription and mRNA export factor ENY2 n=1 Tax=Dimorphilus gyrociliatus TaxID=2664684 RepID=A0A7I8VL58_9ANNE|nr:DgyrCDS5312 [Dimorphilus gyrociliatus]
MGDRELIIRETINQKLEETGEKEKLKRLLRMRLDECGWREKVRAYCKQVIRERGIETVSVDDLVAEVTPKGRALVPDTVKKELLHKIRQFLTEQANV